MLDRFFDKSQPELSKVQEGKDKVEEKANQKPEASAPSKFEIKSLDINAARDIRSDSHAKELIAEALQREYPNQSFNRFVDEMGFRKKSDTGRVDTNTGRDGWSREVRYDVFWEGRPVMCEYVERDFLSDGGHRSVSRSLEKKES